MFLGGLCVPCGNALSSRSLYRGAAALPAAVHHAHHDARDDQQHSQQRCYAVRFAKDKPADRERVNEAGVIDYRDAGDARVAARWSKRSALAEKVPQPEKVKPVEPLRRFPLEEQADKARDHAHKLKMEHNRQRMLAPRRLRTKLYAIPEQNAEKIPMER